MEEMMNLGGDDMDLTLLSRSFPAGTPRVEKRDEHYLLILESEESRDDAAVIADGTNVLALMVAIMLTDGANFRRPRIQGMTKQNADGSLSHFVNMSVKIEARASLSVNQRLIGPDGTEIEKDKGPDRTSNRVATCTRQRTISPSAGNLGIAGTYLGESLQGARCDEGSAW